MDEAGEKSGRFGWLGTPAARLCLWIAIILLGGLSALYAYLHPYFRQRAAVRAIEAAGGRVILDEIKYDEDNYFVSLWRLLLEGVFGDDNYFVSEATSAIITTDESMHALGGLINLKYLTLQGEDITDAALDHLDLCTHLECIDISADHITKAGLKQLDGKWLPKLKALELFGKTVIIDEELLEHYGRSGLLRRLVNLSLVDCGMRDASLIFLNMSPDLNELCLTGNDITDDGLQHIKDLPKLEILILVNTKITDAGLDILAEMKSLQLLYVPKTKVTREGVEKFRKARPDCKISRIITPRDKSPL